MNAVIYQNMLVCYSHEIAQMILRSFYRLFWVEGSCIFDVCIVLLHRSFYYKNHTVPMESNPHQLREKNSIRIIILKTKVPGTLYLVIKYCKQNQLVLQAVSVLYAREFYKVCLTNAITDNLNAQGVSLLINFKNVLERYQTAFLVIHAGLLTYLDNAVHCKVDAV